MGRSGLTASPRKASPLSTRRGNLQKPMPSILGRQTKKSGLWHGVCSRAFKTPWTSAVAAAVVSVILYQTYIFLDWKNPVRKTFDSWSQLLEIDNTTKKPTGRMLDEDDYSLEDLTTECQIDYFTRLSVDDFFASYHGNKPVMFRSPNYPNVDVLKELERSTLLQKYGNISVGVATSMDGIFALGASSQSELPLKEVIKLISTWPARDVYFFDSARGHFLSNARRETGSTPMDAYRPPPHFTGIAKEFEDTHPRMTIGGAGSGLSFHQHTSTYNELFVGAKRWSLYGPGTAPVNQGYTLFQSHRAWLRARLNASTREKDPSPLECIQFPGDVLYIPDGWLHATVNLRRTISIARNAKSALPGTAMYFHNKAVRLMQDEHRQRRATKEELQRAEKLMRRAVEVDPTNAHYYSQLSMALSKQQKYAAEYRAISKGLSLNKQCTSMRHNLVHSLLDLYIHGIVIEDENSKKPIDWLVKAYEAIVDQHVHYGGLKISPNNYDFFKLLLRIALELEKEYPVKEHILSDGTHLTGQLVRSFRMKSGYEEK